MKLHQPFLPLEFLFLFHASSLLIELMREVVWWLPQDIIDVNDSQVPVPIKPRPTSFLLSQLKRWTLNLGKSWPFFYGGQIESVCRPKRPWHEVSLISWKFWQKLGPRPREKTTFLSFLFYSFANFFYVFSHSINTLRLEVLAKSTFIVEAC